MCKKVFSLLLAAALALSLGACGKTGTGAAPGNTGAGANAGAPAGAVTAMGRWIEEKADFSAFPGYLPQVGPVQLADGRVWLCLVNDIDRASIAVTSSDGGRTWQQMDDPGWQDLAGFCLPLAAAPDGATLVRAMYASPDGSDVFYLCRPGQAPQLLDLSAIPDFAGVLTAVFHGNDTVLLLPSVTRAPGSGDTTAIVSSDGDGGPMIRPAQEAWLLSTGDGSLTRLSYDAAAWPELYMYRFAACDGGWRIIGYNGQLATLALDGGITPDGVGPFNAANGLALAADPEGNTCVACADGIARLSAGGTLPEFLVEGLGTALALDNSYLREMCRTDGGSFLVNVMENMPAPSESDEDVTTSVYRYFYDETLPAVNTSGLEVWTLYDNATVRQAVNVYLQQHGDIDVTLTVGAPDLDAAETFGRTADEMNAINDALTTLNTALLAGSGPDVLILDGAGYENYARRGLLADLSGAVPLADLAQNLTAPFMQDDGSVYVLPARFSAPVALADDGDTAGLASLDTLQAAILAGAPRPADSDSEYYTPLDPKYALDFASANSLGDYLLYTGGAALLHDGTLDGNALRRAFTFAAAVGGHYGMASYTAETQMGSAGGASGQDAVTTWPRSEKYLQCDRARWGWELMQTPALCAKQRTAGGVLSGGETVPGTVVSAPGLCPGAWLPGTLAAVSAASSNQQAALDLAAALFSAAVQDVYCGDGMPVRSDSLAASIERNLAGADHFTGDANALLAGLQTPVTVPPVLETSFKAHLAALLQNAEDVDAAVAGVQSDLALYLAEQQ